LQGKVGIASDQYALAVVVYEWLMGQPPFRGSFVEGASQHMFVQPPPLRTVRPEITPELETVVMTGLAKVPGERFVCIAAFAQALEAAWNDEALTQFSPFSPSALSSPQASQEIYATDSPTYLTPAMQPAPQLLHKTLSPVTSDIFQHIQATPVPEALRPSLATPLPEAWTPGQAPAVPERANNPLSVPRE
jgi:serine/threonine protein kinase